MKPVTQLTVADLKTHPVWEFVMDIEEDLPDETYVRPVEKLPVDSLDNRITSALLTLSNGQKVLGMLGNVDLSNPTSTEHFVSVTVFNSSGDSFNLARYHDVDCEQQNAVSLAAFLGLSLEAVFPILYDISDIATGQPASVRGTIEKSPSVRLSRKELIELALK